MVYINGNATKKNIFPSPQQSNQSEIEFNIYNVSIYPYERIFVWAADPIDLRSQYINEINNSNSI